MKLVHDSFQFHIELPEGEIIHLIVESPSLFYEYSKEIMKQIQGDEGRFLLSHEGQSVNIGKSVGTALSPFSIDSNQKPIVSKAISLIKEEILTSSYLESLQQINNIISNMIDDAAVTLNLSINYEQITDVNTLLKVMSIDFDEISDLSLTEQLIDYIKIIKNIMSTKIYVFCNFSPFLNGSDVMHLQKLCQHEKVTILMIDNMNRESFIGKKYIIDKDLCEIV